MPGGVPGARWLCSLQRAVFLLWQASVIAWIDSTVNWNPKGVAIPLFRTRQEQQIEPSTHLNERQTKSAPVAVDARTARNGHNRKGKDTKITFAGGNRDDRTDRVLLLSLVYARAYIMCGRYPFWVKGIPDPTTRVYTFHLWESSSGASHNNQTHAG